jgi:hypothetical protein
MINTHGSQSDPDLAVAALGNVQTELTIVAPRKRRIEVTAIDHTATDGRLADGILLAGGRWRIIACIR